MPRLPAADRFKKLVEDISRLYINAREAQIAFAWQTGKRIVEEEQNGVLKAEYGTKLIPELSRVLTKKYDQGFSERNLWRMRHFYEFHPILPPPAELAWTDYVELMPVRDTKIRKRLEQRILKEGLKSKDIRQEVRRLSLEKTQEHKSTGTPAASKAVTPLKRPADLRLNTFAPASSSMPLKDGQALIDCGFFVYQPVKKEKCAGLDLEGRAYTYKAFVERVVDGDTLLVTIETGLGPLVRERLRLRGINCPELATPQGVRAKKFVEKLLPAGSVIVLKSHKCKTDIYGRFVADVFALEGVSNAAVIARDGVYVNQLLLDEGLAENF